MDLTMVMPISRRDFSKYERLRLTDGRVDCTEQTCAGSRMNSGALRSPLSCMFGSGAGVRSSVPETRAWHAEHLSTVHVTYAHAMEPPVIECGASTRCLLVHTWMLGGTDQVESAHALVDRTVRLAGEAHLRACTTQG